MPNPPLTEMPRGRSARSNPPNRFTRLSVELEDPADLDARTIYFEDSSRSAITTNDSPDVPFEASLNPYRGCEHGCAYCYARPTHEYLGLSAGLDFESRIFVKRDAPELLARELAAPAWQPKVLALSGVTDAYQPVERKLEITRRCLAVLAEHRHPVAIVTKNQLVTRDADHLEELARFQAAGVYLSITTLDGELSRRLEPRASHPEQRLAAIAELSRRRIPVGVLVAPVIPGITDHEIPRILAAAAEAGARASRMILLRLPGAVAPLFEDWLEHWFPDRKAKVLHHLREMRGGRLNDPRFGHRMRGSGPLAEGLYSLFATASRRAGLTGKGLELSTAAFRRPRGPQLGLFDE